MAQATTPNKLPTNPLQRMKIELAAEQAARRSLEDSLRYLRDHVRSDKFRSEPYINVADVLLWTEQASQAADHAQQEVYVYARLRPVLHPLDFRMITDLTLVAEQGHYTDGSLSTTRFAVAPEHLQDGLEVLRHDGYHTVEVEEFVDGRWRYKGRHNLRTAV